VTTFDVKLTLMGIAVSLQDSICLR